MQMHIKHHNTIPPRGETPPPNCEPGLDSDDWGVDWMQSRTPMNDKFSNSANPRGSSYRLFSEFLTRDEEGNRTGHSSPDMAAWFHQRRF
jgi:hypothetical protein